MSKKLHMLQRWITPRGLRKHLGGCHRRIDDTYVCDAVDREAARFQGEILRLFGMHQLTTEDILRALRTRFNVELTEDELYEVAKYSFEMAQGMYDRIARESKLELSDTWLLLAEKEFCLVVDSSIEFILAARQGTDKVKVLKDAIKVSKRVPKTLITRGVKDAHPLTKICPAIAIGPKGIDAFNEMIAVLIKDELIGQKFSRKELESRRRNRRTSNRRVLYQQANQTRIRCAPTRPTHVLSRTKTRGN